MTSSYQNEDKSILLPYFRRFLWDPMGELIPDRVAPNSLTLIGILCAVSSLVTAVLIDPRQHVLYVIPAALLFAYLCLDNLDGAHARKTKQGSPLGEFIDHWLDTLSGPLVTWGVCHGLDLPHELVLWLLAVTILAVFATYWEQRWTGVMKMGRIGNIEGLVVLLLLYLALAVFGAELITHTRLFGVISVAQIVALWVFVQMTVTALGCLIRVRTRGDHRPWLYLVASLALSLAWFRAGTPSYLAIGAIFVSLNALFSGRMLIARLLEQASERQLIVVPMMLFAGYTVVLPGYSETVQCIASIILAVILGAWMAYDFCICVHGLRRYLREDEFLGRIFLR